VICERRAGRADVSRCERNDARLDLMKGNVGGRFRAVIGAGGIGPDRVDAVGAASRAVRLTFKIAHLVCPNKSAHIQCGAIRKSCFEGVNFFGLINLAEIFLAGVASCEFALSEPRRNSDQDDDAEDGNDDHDLNECVCIVLQLWFHRSHVLPKFMSH
jgi:hypothetical protein